jgi:hypothetical protein
MYPTRFSGVLTSCTVHVLTTLSQIFLPVPAKKSVFYFCQPVAELSHMESAAWREDHNSVNNATGHKDRMTQKFALAYIYLFSLQWFGSGSELDPASNQVSGFTKTENF